MKFDTKQIIEITKASLLNSELYESEINSFCYDSRKISVPTTTIFFAFIGHDQDGHNFIPNAYAQGVRSFIVTKSLELEDFPKANFFKVENALESLQKLSTSYRENIQTKVLAITGSNGKTIVKEWLGQLLNPLVYKSPLSYNSQLGVAISLSKIPQTSPLAIIEAGISKKGEMETLEKMTRPNYVLFTNLGSAHEEGFENQAEKLSEKFILAQNADRIYCSSNQSVVTAFLKEKYPTKKIVSWGRSENDSLKILNQNDQFHSTIIKVEFDGSQYDIAIPFVDNISIENAMHALNFAFDQAKLKQTDINEIISKTTKLKTIRLRLEILEGINDCKIINDAYIFDLYALRRAINFQHIHKEDKTLTVILSDIHHGRKSKPELASEVSELLNNSEIDRVIMIGEDGLDLSSFLKSEIQFTKINSTNNLNNLKFNNECILIKGSRSSNLETSLDYLEKRAYTSRLEINLSAISENYNYYKSKLKSKTGIMVVLKAGAYGSGSLSLARMLEEKQVDYILVAHIDEGIELRNNGIMTSIVVLNPDPHSLYKLFEYNLESELYSLEILEKIDRLSKQYQSTMNIHVNLDTGMHRLGLKENDISSLINTVNNNPFLHVESIFSHLAASEDSAHDQFSHQQYNAFIKQAKHIEQALDIQTKKHILNSAGILRFPDYHMDLVRLGLGLYGIDSSGQSEGELRKVHTLVAHVLQVKKLTAGQTVGYSQTFKASTDMRIATLNIGYGDGLPRHLSNGNWKVKIQGQLVPIIGRISMDLTSVDISSIKQVEVGEEVIIFDDSQKIEELSTYASTIPYEILTNISSRVKRIYFTE